MTAIKVTELGRALELHFDSASKLCEKMEELRKQGVTQFFVEHAQQNLWILRYVTS